MNRRLLGYQTKPENKPHQNILLNLLNIQNKKIILKSAREVCQATCKGRPSKLHQISHRNYKSKRAWHDVFQALNKK
jgi:hypothetical protein